MAFTAGGGGAPRPISLSHQQVLHRTAATIAANGWTSDERTFNAFPLHHVSGLLLFHVRDTWLGVDQGMAPRGRVVAQPQDLLDGIDTMRATLSWSTPGVLDRLTHELETGDRPLALGSLHTVLVGGDRLLGRQRHRIARLLGVREAAIVPGFGFTEAGSGITHGGGQLTATGLTSVGEPEPGTAVRVARPNGCDMGRLEVSGPSLSDDGTWHDTGDVATILDRQLVVHGRFEDVVEIEGSPLHLADIEAVARCLDWKRPDAITATREDGGIALHVHSADVTAPAMGRVRGLLRDRVGAEVVAIRSLVGEGPPMSHHGRLLRSALRADPPAAVPL
ncbi:AMP-binding protein [Knoellia sp. CPCC 206453]|uniref:AMP-binding protein n=1 Tax=Knoellia pratensis TaxID=3404796 RepID=UPI0036179762